MSEFTYAFVRGELPVLVPVQRACERGGFHVQLAKTGPTGELDGPAVDGSERSRHVDLARDIEALIELQLKQMRASGTTLYKVHIGETWDPMLAPLEVQNLTLQAIAALARAGVDVELRTRAALSRTAVDTLVEYADRLRVVLPFVSMRPDLAQVWEPGAATPGERLRCARSLSARGVRVVGRAEPLLPLINDTQADIDEFCVAFAGVGMQRAVAAYLRLTPRRAKAMSRQLPRMHRDILKGCFVGQSWRKDDKGASYKVLARAIRERGLRRFVETGQKQGLPVSICACSDGDVMAGGCHNQTLGGGQRRQQPALTVEPGGQGQLDFFALPAAASE